MAAAKIRGMLAILMLMVGLNIHAAEPIAVVLFPFDVNSRVDLSLVQRAVMDLIPPRVARGGFISFVGMERTDLTRPEGIALGNRLDAARSLGADAAIVGTITKLGSKMSLDATIHLLQAGFNPLLLSVPVDEESRLIGQIDLLARQIRASLLRAAVASRAPSQTQPQQPSPSGPPGIVLKRAPTEPTLPEAYYDLPPSVQRPDARMARSIRVRKYVRGICFGDLDGDQKSELVILTDNSVGFYTPVDSGWQVGPEYKARPGDQFLTVQCGDAQKTGRAKLYVSNYRHGVQSFVLELHRGALRPVQEGLPYLLAVVEVPGEGEAVLGQELGPPGTPLVGEFRPERYLLQWTNGALKRVGQVTLPEEVNRIFGVSFADLDGDGRLELVRMSQAGSLYVLPFKGQIQTVMEKNFGSTINQIDVKQNPRSVGEHASDDRRTVAIPARIKAIHVSSAGADQLVVPDFVAPNPIALRMYNQGRIQGVGWNGKELRVLWSTELYDSAILDFDILERNGSRELVFAVSSGGGTKIIFQPMIEG